MNRIKAEKYSNISKILHWMIAVMVLLMLSGSFFLSSLPENFQPVAYMYHKSSGLTVLFLMIMRLFCIYLFGRPPLPESVPLWDRCLSRLVQYTLYVVLLVMPLSGWIMSMAGGRIPVYFGLFPVAFPGIPISDSLHEWMDLGHKTIAWVLIALISTHILGALRQYFIKKNQVLQQMFFSS